MNRLKFNLKESKNKWIAFIILAFLIATNPGIRSFKEYLGESSYNGLSRKYNLFVLSIFNDGSGNYIGISENFIKLYSASISAETVISVDSAKTDSVKMSEAETNVWTRPKTDSVVKAWTPPPGVILVKKTSDSTIVK